MRLLIRLASSGGRVVYIADAGCPKEVPTEAEKRQRGRERSQKSEVRIGRPPTSDLGSLSLHVHTHQELSVRLCLRQASDEQLHSVGWVHVGQDAAHDRDAAKFLRVHENFFPPRAAFI